MKIQKDKQNNSRISGQNGSSEIDYSRKWYVMAAVGMGIFLATIDGSIVNVALPTLVHDFNSKFPVVQWVALSYMLTLTALILSMGRLGDIKGKKPVYTAGMVLFLVGSIFCGLSQSIGQLIGFRVLQAVGAAMMAALGTAILTEAFPQRERGKAFGIVGACVSVGIIAGPTLGGLLIDAFTWHWIFFVNIPIGIAGIMMVIKFVQNTKPEKGQRFDFWGAFTLFVSISSFLLGITSLQNFGISHPYFITLMVLWLVFMLLFFWVELNTRQPLIDLYLFKNRLFDINLTIGFISFLGTSGVVLLMPFFLQNVLHYSPRHVGMLLSVLPVAAGVISPISGALSDRFGTRPITALGLFILLGGYITLGTINEQTTTVEFILKFFPIGLGLGIFQSPNNSAIMGTAPSNRLGLVSGLLSITRTFGQSTGIALSGVFWIVRTSYHSGTGLLKDVHSAPISSQMKGIQDTLFFISMLIAIALILGITGFFYEKKQQKTHQEIFVD